MDSQEKKPTTPGTKLPLGARPKILGTNNFRRKGPATAAKAGGTDHLEPAQRKSDISKSNPRRLKDPGAGNENVELISHAKSFHNKHRSRNVGAAGNQVKRNKGKSERGKASGDCDDASGSQRSTQHLLNSSHSRVHDSTVRTNLQGGDDGGKKTRNGRGRGGPPNSAARSISGQRASGTTFRGRQSDRDQTNDHSTTNKRLESSRGGRRNASDNRGRKNSGSSISSNRPPQHSQRSDRRPRRRRPLDITRLQELLGREPDEIVMELASAKSGFKELLNELVMPRELVTLLLAIMAKACGCTSSPKNLNSCLAIVVWHSVFLTTHLLLFVPQLLDSAGQGLLANVKSFNDLITLLKELLVHLPSSSSEVKVFTPLMQRVVQDITNIPAETKTRVEEISDTCDMLLKSGSTLSERRMLKNQYKAPPDDFRKIEIIPGIKELGKSKRPFLRHNLSKGRYEDVDHYLDVQFRLLREDFVAPLREGIAEYLEKRIDLENNPNKRLQDIRLYFDVRIIRPTMTRSGPGHLIQFDVSRFRGVRWESSKRLIQGSLLCLTSNTFQDVIFATVEERDVRDLQNGRIEVKFINLGDVLGVPRDLVFIMAETSAYFEAYRHVLGGLQEYNENNLAMQTYIIDASVNTDHPEYLRGDYANLQYDLRPLVLNKPSIEDESVIAQARRQRHMERLLRAINVLEPRQWPDSKYLDFDDTQLAAYQAALSSEFVLIQGPPGTGKTYVGLKIVKTLLFNHQSWGYDYNDDEWDIRPILVVCYTNHALDQFLEGIYEYETGIIRVGGRCSSEKLQARTLFEIRQQQKADRAVPEYIRQRKADLQDYYDMRTILQTANDRIRLAQTGVLRAETLYGMGIIPLKQYRSLLNQQSNPDPMYDWLGLDGKGLQRAATQPRKNRNGDSGDQGENVVISDDESDDELNIDEEAELLAEQRQLGNDPTFQKLRDESRLKVFSEFAFVPGKRRGTSENKDGSHERRQAERSIRFAVNSSDMMTSTEVEDISDRLWELRYQQRWKLYRYWLQEYFDFQEQIMWRYHTAFEKLSEERKEIEREEDYQLLKKARVIGMTTTGAAKNRILLQRLRPRIIVVEEAAEVLEAHVITTLSKDCQHLILIGDHQQLRPNPTVYRLAKHYDLDVSLFERMINNGLPCHRLGLQHRMRPEISLLMKEHFYEGLEDDISVMHYKNIMGVKTNMFFVEHDHKELRVGDTTSKSNLHEAQFLVKLCHYLLKQGYEPTQITILTTYTGQLFHFKKLMDKDTFEGVRVSVVDNYQGEENDIVLLSLVRSNEEGSIGFLKVHNRVCVALSRAREDLFCIGNVRLLAEQSELWKGILKSLEDPKEDVIQQRQGSMATVVAQIRGVGPGLPLFCQNHPETVTEVSCAEDFLMVPDGGCMLPCQFRLECGHACEMHCHPKDPEHDEYKCKKDCVKACLRGHECPLRCYEECKCPVILTKTFTVCQHKERIQCHIIETATCQRPCMIKRPCTHPCPSKCGDECPEECTFWCLKKIKDCGHSCRNKCGRPCTTWQRCNQPIEIRLPKCGHNIFMECKDNPEKRAVPQYPTCNHPCDRKKKCGHNCSNLCKDPCERDIECRVPVTKTWPNCEHSVGLECKYARDALCARLCQRRLSCGHRCLKLCHQACEPVICEQQCQRILQCKHTCPKKCGELCATRCTRKTKKELPGCKHVVQLQCHVDITTFECRETCGKTLPCGHTCKEPCGDPCTDICQEKTNKVLPKCGHKMSLFCYQDPAQDGLCKGKCQTKFPCGHYCRRQCGEICEEKCGKMVTKTFPDCKHTQEMLCADDIASVRCQSVCTKILPCKHNCAAKCGQLICTQYCRVKVFKEHPLCGHLLMMTCHEDPGTIECKRQCKLKLSCGKHRCSNPCSELCQAICNATMTKTLKCGHEIICSCYENPEDCKCPESCMELLSCGHPCPRGCADQCPDASMCQRPCMKTITGCNHPCPRKCSESCAVADVCKVKVVKKIPGCGHEAEMQCCEDPSRATCRKACKKKRSCGHRCQNLCSQPCQSANDVCKILVNKNIPGCGHRTQMKCHEDPAEALCLWKVNKVIRKCGHTAKIPCHLDPDTGSICINRCQELLPCGHPCQEKCGRPCTKLCKEKVAALLLSCNHVAKDVACHVKPASISCKAHCMKLLDCDHECKKVCGDCSHGNKTVKPRGTALPLCNDICQKTLRCGHRCQSKCRDCAGGRFHQPCRIQTNIKLLCGCTMKSQCSKVLSACHNPGDRRNNRGHGGGNSQRRCLLQYTSMEKSSSRHSPPAANQRSVLTTSLRDDQPCRQLLPCNHCCIGVSGEPCLKLCRFCNRRKVLEICPAFQLDRDPYFVQLKECGHIFEATDLDRQLSMSPFPSSCVENCTPIVPTVCPKCHRIITNARYKEHKEIVVQRIKTAYRYSEEQQSRSKRDVSDMLRKHTYKFKATRSARSRTGKIDASRRRPEAEMAWKFQILNVLEKIEVLRLPTPAGHAFAITKQCRETHSSVQREIRRRLMEMLDGGTFLTEQLAEDISCELERLQMCEVIVSLISRRIWKIDWTSIVEIVTSPRRFTRERCRETVPILGMYSRYLPTMHLAEFRSISAILRTRRLQTGIIVGEWFVCSRDHVFHYRRNIDARTHGLGRGAPDEQESPRSDYPRCPFCRCPSRLLLLSCVPEGGGTCV